MFSAVSLNLAKESAAVTVVRAIENAPRMHGADVFLFQEVRHAEGKPSVACEVADRLGYSSAFTAAPGFVDQGLAIVSRYPVSNVQVTRLKFCNLRFRSRNRVAIAATVETPWGGVRVWNVHLDTRINASERIAQLQPVIEDALRYQGPKLIGGDFNTNELYWVGNVLPLPLGPAHGSTIRHSMKLLGFDTPFPGGVNTFPLLGRHLDWIFVSELKTLDASVEPAPFSDHHAIWVGARL
jgi:endonuclease/exonuclease/phosphatase family metal-dependent hydrolase